MKKHLVNSGPDTQSPFHFYRQALDILQRARVPFLVGGAYALAHYTGIIRHTKDFDLFVRRCHLKKALRAFQDSGYRADLIFPHWLAKVFHEEDFIDLIFNSGNNLCPVDQSWFEHAESADIFEVPVQLMPAEEMIWQKAYIMERERFDGADVLHLLRARGGRLDWQRLLSRFGDHWRVLFSHLVLFGFVYADEQDAIPTEVLRQLMDRLPDQAPTNSPPVCRGPFLSRIQYLADTERWGYADPRRLPLGRMTAKEISIWTNAAG